MVKGTCALLQLTLTSCCDTLVSHLQVLQEASASGGTHIAIVSDANTVFIDYILQAQGIQVRAGHIAIASDANTVFINYILQAQGIPV